MALVVRSGLQEMWEEGGWHIYYWTRQKTMGGTGSQPTDDGNDAGRLVRCSVAAFDQVWFDVIGLRLQAGSLCRFGVIMCGRSCPQMLERFQDPVTNSPSISPEMIHVCIRRLQKLFSLSR